MTDSQMSSLLAAASQRYQERDHEEALRLCDVHLSMYPSDAAAFQLKGSIFLTAGKRNDAIAAYKKAILSAPHRPECYAYLGEIFDSNGESEEAVKYYQKAIQLKPDWQPVVYNLARAYLRLKNYQAALQSYQAALRLDQYDAKSHNDLGVVCEAFSDLSSALEHYRFAVKLEPKRVRARENLASALLRQQDPERSLSFLEESLKVFPCHSKFYSLKAQSEQLLGRTESAIASAIRGLQLAPDNSEIHELLGSLFSESRHLDAALTCFQRSLELDPENLDRYGYCAQTAIKLNHVEEAIGYFKQAFNRLSAGNSPNIVQWLKKLQSPLQELSALDTYELAFGARGEFLSSLQSGVSLRDCRASLANLYARWGDVRLVSQSYLEAEAYFEAAVSVDPQHLTALESLQRTKSYLTGLKDWEKLPRTQFIPSCLVTKSRNWLNRTPNAHYYPLHEFDEESYNSPNIRYECKGLNCYPCLRQIQEQFTPIRLGDKSYTCRYSEISTSSKQDLFTASIPAGRTWVMPQESWWQVCEAIATVTPDNMLLADLSREYPGELPGCQVSARNASDHRIFQKNRLPDLEKIDGCVAVLCGLSANVYFHWLIDILPRLAILRQSEINEEKIDYFYVNSNAKRFQKETLALLGVPQERIIESDRYPHIQAKTLVVPSFVGHIGWATPKTIEFLRYNFLPLAQGKSEKSSLCLSSFSGDFPKRIYISRRSSRYRRVINEAALINKLQAKGFTPIELERHSFLDQVRIFLHAEVIIAPHGAGLTNLVFCCAGTVVIEMFSPNYLRYYYWIICKYLKLTLYYIIGEDLPCKALRSLMYPDTLAEDFYVSLEQVQEILDLLELVDG